MTLFSADVNPDVVNAARQFGVVGICRTSLASGGFSGAAVYRIECATGHVFAARRTPADLTLPVSRRESLHRTLRMLYDGGLQVIPVPLAVQGLQNHSGSGRSAHQIDGPAQFQVGDSWLRIGADVWQVEPWMPGTPANAAPTDSMVRSALRTLHAFHSGAKHHWAASEATEHFFCKAGASPGVQRRFGIVSELCSGQLLRYQSQLGREPIPQVRNHGLRVCRVLERWLPWLQSRLNKLAAEQFPLQPVIRDLWRPHVLFTGDEVTGLIDLSAMASDHICFDVTRLLRSWFGADTLRLRQSIELFSELRPLSEKEKTLLQAVDAATVLLSPVTWFRRRFEQREQIVWSEEMSSRLAELADTVEHFEPV